MSPNVAATREAVEVTDDELIALAMGGDPDMVIPDDAVPFGSGDDDAGLGLLPDWYMPSPMEGTPQLRGWRRIVAYVIIASFLAIVASGLCSTYGEITIA